MTHLLCFYSVFIRFDRVGKQHPGTTINVEIEHGPSGQIDVDIAYQEFLLFHLTLGVNLAVGGDDLGPGVLVIHMDTITGGEPDGVFRGPREIGRAHV